MALKFQQFLDASGKMPAQVGTIDADVNAALDFFANGGGSVGAGMAAEGSGSDDDEGRECTHAA